MRHLRFPVLAVIVLGFAVAPARAGATNFVSCPPQLVAAPLTEQMSGFLGMRFRFLLTLQNTGTQPLTFTVGLDMAGLSPEFTPGVPEGVAAGVPIGPGATLVLDIGSSTLPSVDTVAKVQQGLTITCLPGR